MPAADTTAPVLTSLTFPSSVDVTAGGRNITFTASATDQGLGVSSVSVQFTKSWQDRYGNTSSFYAIDSTDSFSDGNSSNGFYIDDSSGAGTYSISYVYVYDKAGNYTYYSGSQLASMGIQNSFAIVDQHSATAAVTAPALLTEGQGVSGALTLNLTNPSQRTGTVSVSLVADGPNAAGASDVSLASGTASYSVPTGSNAAAINLPALNVRNDYAYEGDETITLKVTAPGQVFDNGSDTTLVTITLRDDERAPDRSGDVGDFAIDMTRGDDANDPVRLSFDLALSDAFSNASSVMLLFWPVKSGADAVPHWTGDQTWITLIRGTDGRFHATVPLSPQATSADYAVRSIRAVSNAGNNVDITDGTLRGHGFPDRFSFQNPFADNTPPSLRSITVSEPARDANGYGVEVALTVADAGSGVDWGDVIVEFVGPGGESIQQRASALGDGNGVARFRLSEYAQSGEYRINTVRLFDQALNGTMHYDPSKFGGLVGFTLDNPTQDAVGPTLADWSAELALDPVSGRLQLAYEMDWNDNVSGVARAYVRVFLPDGTLRDRWVYTDAHGGAQGAIDLGSPAPSGQYRVELTGYDNAGNKVGYFSDDLKARNLDAEWLAVGPASTAAGAIITDGRGGASLFGTLFDDRLTGGEGAQRLLGGGGSDLLDGGTGADMLLGGAGTDTLLGGGGDDTLSGGSGSDLLDGGAGFDTVTYADADGPLIVRLDLRARETGEGIDMYRSIERVVGSAFADTIYGTAGTQELLGGAGDDRLYGLGGDDVLIGGAGRDAVTGGLGADTFRFERLSDFGQGSAVDVVNDFSRAQGDKLDLSALGELVFIGTAAFAKDGQAQVRYFAGNSTVVQIDLNGDGAADAAFRLTGQHALLAGDFMF